jgi:hypothetical protein
LLLPREGGFKKVMSQDLGGFLVRQCRSAWLALFIWCAPEIDGLNRRLAAYNHTISVWSMPAQRMLNHMDGVRLPSLKASNSKYDLGCEMSHGAITGHCEIDPN